MLASNYLGAGFTNPILGSGGDNGLGSATGQGAQQQVMGNMEYQNNNQVDMFQNQPNAGGTGAAGVQQVQL